MVGSWVSQASFEPPGLTIAIAKDRAIESMMQVRACAFVLPPPPLLHLHVLPDAVLFDACAAVVLPVGVVWRVVC